MICRSGHTIRAFGDRPLCTRLKALTSASSWAAKPPISSCW
jgi:hypothetical protein